MRSLRLFATVVGVEGLKLKRTLALAMVVLAPIVVVFLHGLIGYAGGASLGRGGRPAWPQLVNNAVAMWTLLMMPLFITLETSLLAGLEHGGNWKSALTLPVPRWMLYAAKLLLAILLLWGAHAVLVMGIYGAAVILRAVQPALGLTDLPFEPLTRPMLAVSAAALLGLAIQHWVSLRYHSFPAAIGFGMFAMVSGFVAANSADWGRLWPWSLPLHAMRSAEAHDTGLVVAGLVGALIVGLAGCAGFTRREIG